MVNRVFFGLWCLAFLTSLNMPVQAIRHPYVEIERVATRD
jgi:hypothetical protein